MAHYEKFSKQGLGHIFAHVRRAYTIDENGCKRYANFGNKEIDTTRTHLNYKLAEEYTTLKEKFQGSGLKLSAEMAQYIVRTGQKEQFAEYQRSIDHQQGEERS